MGYKRITLNTVIGLVLIAAAAFTGGFLEARYPQRGFLLILLVIPPAGWAVFRMFTLANRQIAFFFDAIRNDDFTLQFPSNPGQRSLQKLFQSLNNLSGKIREIKLKNEYLEKYYQTFIQQAATGLLALNRDNEVEIMNDKAFEYAGIPPYTPLHLVPMRNPGLFAVLAALNPGEALTYTPATGDTRITLLARTKEIRFGDKATRIISLQDIRQELEATELDSWQKLIRVLTHEIMNSIAPIVSLTGSLRQFFVKQNGPVDPADIDSETIGNVILGLDTIGERGNGLVAFVDNYRKLTRIPKPEFTSFIVREWFETVTLLLKSRLDEWNVNFETAVDPRLREMSGDKTLLTQVLINILNNALEALAALPEGRHILLTAELSHQNRPLIRISNNGPRIPGDVLDKIFIPFFTTREQGSGIGLSLSRQIMRLHKGYIHAESSEKATTFVLTF